MQKPVAMPGIPVNAARPHSPAAISTRQEPQIVLLLCCLASLHVFIFSAAFPFFSVVDEDSHFDMVVKYSHGHVPRGMETVSKESAEYIATYATREYLSAPEQMPEGKFPPPKSSQPITEESRKIFGYEVKALMGINPESSHPPVYYALAGMWWNLGKAIGLETGDSLYWIRFLNMILVALLVWLGNVAARTVFPENGFVRLGVPALMAFIPQTAFYSIQNDVLSPLCFGVVFILLLRWSRNDLPNVPLACGIGLALGATYLTKVSNLPLLGAAALFVLAKVGRWLRAGQFRTHLPALVLMGLCAGIPISLWRAWSKYHFGDFTGSTMKMSLLGWTQKPFAEWWSHPLFSVQGLWTFSSKLLATFWQGEFLWHRQPLAFPAVDIVYFILSAGFLGISLITLLPRTKRGADGQTHACWFSFFCLFSAVAFLGFLSIIFDFHDCFYPSREHPYFTSGRLMLGTLIPFLLLFVYGMDRALIPIKSGWVRPFVLIALILFMLISETAINWPVFFSTYNWFHL